MAIAKDSAADLITEYVTVTIGDHLFGLPIFRVQDVFVPDRLTRVPLAPPEVAGILNLRDATTATKALDDIKNTIDAAKGRFNGLSGGGATDIIARAPTQLGWDARGHYLVFCVIARADGAAVDPNSPGVTQLTRDMIQNYLEGVVLHAREVNGPPSAVPSGK